MAETSGEAGGWGGNPEERARSFDAAAGAAADRDALITLRGRTKVFNVPVGEILKKMGKESLLSVPVGVVAGMAVGTMGLGAAAGLVTSGLAGAAKEGIKEHGRQTTEKWERIRTEKGVNRLWNPWDLARGFLNPDEKRKLGAAIGKGTLKGLVFGSAGGAFGGVIGGALADTAVGHAAGAVAENVRGLTGGALVAAREAVGHVGGVKDAAGAWKDSWGLPGAGQLGIPVASEVPPAPATEPQAPGRGIPLVGRAADVIGGGFHDTGLKIHETTGLGIDQAPSGRVPGSESVAPTEPEPAPAGGPPAPSAPYPEPIAVSINNPEIQIPDDAPQWMKEANDINKEYGLAKQALVGEYFFAENNNVVDKAIESYLSSQGKTLVDLSPLELETIKDHLMHVMEVHVNQDFDSRLPEAVNKNISLEEMKSIGRESFEEWINSGGFNTEMVQEAAKVVEVHNQINEIMSTTKLGGYEIPVSADVSFSFAVEDYFKNAPRPPSLDQFIPQSLGIHIASNYDVLYNGWNRVHPDLPFPVHLGEAVYLVEKAEAGDVDALMRLKAAFSGIAKGGEYFYFGGGIPILDRIYDLLKQLR